MRKVSGAAADRLLLNEGKINITNGGFGFFIAGAIENKGLITAQAGTIAMAGGDGVRLTIQRQLTYLDRYREAVAGDILDYQGNKVLDQIQEYRHPGCPGRHHHTYG